MKLCTVGMCNAILGNDLRGCHVSKHLVNEVCVHSIQMYRCTSNIYEVYCPNLKYIITQASVGKHESKNASHSLSSSSYLVAKWGVMGPAVPSIVRGNWEWECDSSLSTWECCDLQRKFGKDLRKMLIVFGTGWPTNYIAWQPAE